MLAMNPLELVIAKVTRLKDASVDVPSIPTPRLSALLQGSIVPNARDAAALALFNKSSAKVAIDVLEKQIALKIKQARDGAPQLVKEMKT